MHGLARFFKGGIQLPFTDEELVQRIKNGDMDAFEELVCRYEGKIYSVAYRFMGNHADAGDLAQDTFIRMYQALPGFRGDSSFATWLYRIAANACRDELRKRQRRRNVSMDELIEHSPTNVPVAASADLPEEAAQRHETQRQVQECLDRLSGDHKLILLMREIQGMSYEEIAAVLGCSLGTVKSRISRARNALKEKIKEKGELLSRSSRLNGKGGKQNALS